jgi:hypothetical protein
VKRKMYPEKINEALKVFVGETVGLSMMPHYLKALAGDELGKIACALKVPKRMLLPEEEAETPFILRR